MFNPFNGEENLKCPKCNGKIPRKLAEKSLSENSKLVCPNCHRELIEIIDQNKLVSSKNSATKSNNVQNDLDNLLKKMETRPKSSNAQDAYNNMNNMLNDLDDIVKKMGK